MRILSVILTLMLSFAVFATDHQIYKIKQSRGRSIDIQFTLDSSTYSRLNVPVKGFDNFIEVPDAPRIPFANFLVKSTPENFKVVMNKKESQKLNRFRVSKKARKICKYRCSSPKDRYVDWTDRDYKTLENYRGTFKVSYLGKFRGTPISQVTVYPVSYDRSANEIELYPDMQVVIQSKSRSAVELFDSEKELEATQPGTWDLKEKNNKVLVVAPRKFQDSKALAEYVLWKKKIGFDVEVKMMEELGSSAEKIKTTIHKIYQSNERRRGQENFSYLVFVGHEKIFPTFYKETSSSYKTPSDLPYVTFDGDDDYIPDVFYSRFVVETEEQLQRQVNKIVEYEKAQHEDYKGLKNGLLIASDEGSSPSDEDYVRMIEKDFGDVYGSEFSVLLQSKGNAIARNINAAFEDGSFWVAYVGHGSGTSWASTNDNYNIDDIDRMAPASIKPIIIDVACQNGRFLPGWFGETFMNSIDRDGKETGAVAYYGGSVNISWHPPAIMSTGINKIKEEQHLKNLGQIVLGGQFYLSENWHNSSDLIDNITWYHLFGDATMMVRTRVPNKVEVKKTTNTLKFLSSDSRERVLGDQVVVFHNGSDKFLIKKTDGAGNVRIPTEAGYSKVSVLAPGHQYFETNI
ncbi:MAG: hypothetical protein H6621_03090 [Halobacteriovoraceae bacterium]|nr:hypothetical protein [Halobacteriovoraceae bacterium]MCB9094031.1 hypothetical protein [Halobacteriovoraceae bacterium]